MANNKRTPGIGTRNGLIFNPILVQAVGLCPVVAMAVSFKTALIIAAISFFILSLTEFIASAFLKVVPRRIRIGVYIILDALLIWPIMTIIEVLDPTLFGSFGIYLPIMAVNSLVVLRCERFAVRLKPSSALRDGITASVGYAVVTVITGAVREIIGSGSLFGYQFWEKRTFPVMLLPFGGFLILGFGAALLRYIISLTWPKYLDKKQPKPVVRRPARAAEPARQRADSNAIPEEKPVFAPEETAINFDARDFDTQRIDLDFAEEEGD